MGQKRGRTEGSFVRETREQTVMFYRDLVQNLKAWQAPAPQIRSEPVSIDASPPPSPPDLLPLMPADRMAASGANADAPEDGETETVAADAAQSGDILRPGNEPLSSESGDAAVADPSMTSTPISPETPWATP